MALAASWADFLDSNASPTVGLLFFVSAQSGVVWASEPDRHNEPAVRAVGRSVRLVANALVIRVHLCSSMVSAHARPAAKWLLNRSCIMRSGRYIRSGSASGRTSIILLSSLTVAVSAIFGIHPQTVSADDWPAFLHDAERSGATKEEVKPPLVKRWEFRNRRPGLLSIVAGGGGVFFGSNADNTFYCLDAATGKVRWSFLLAASCVSLRGWRTAGSTSDRMTVMSTVLAQRTVR